MVVKSSHEVRWLPPMPLLDLFHLASTFAQDSGVTMAASYSTFLRCYREKWKLSLRFRHQHQHFKCSDCERLKEFRRQAATPEEAKMVMDAYANHLRSMYLDRGVRLS